MKHAFSAALDRTPGGREARRARILAIIALLGVLAAQADAALWMRQTTLRMPASLGGGLSSEPVQPTVIASTRPFESVPPFGFLQCRPEPAPAPEAPIAATVARGPSGAPTPGLALHFEKYLPFWASLSTP